ncbi:unnamed protein product [Ectocarpus sp. 4 AP-2014]
MRERSLRRSLRDQQASQRNANSTTTSRVAAAAAAAAAVRALLLLPLLFSEVSAATAVPRGGNSAAAGVDPGTVDEAVGGEGDGGAAAVRGGSGMMQLPRVPFCRAGANVANMWMPVWNPDSQLVEAAKRVVVFGGRGVDYYDKRADDQLSYLSDMWALHITNTGFRWNKVVPIGQVHPSARWQTGNSVAYGASLVVYGGDDQTTNQMGGLGDLWVFSPGGTRSRLHASEKDYSYDSSDRRSEWTEYSRAGKLPGERREPSLTMVNSTLLLQGGKVEDGESNERCDSHFFLVDVGDPQGEWREGSSFPGECGIGGTMNTVNITSKHTADGENEVRAVVFGGCKIAPDGVFSCSNDLYAYDLATNRWEEIVPKSDADAFACEADDTGESPALRPAAATSSSSSSPYAAGNSTVGISSSSSSGGGGGDKKKAVCPGVSTSRPLGRHAHASAYIESKTDNMNALFIFGGRENMDDLIPLGDLWMFDFTTMRWSEMTPNSKKPAPCNRFYHSLTVWQGGVGDGVASLVVFGGETITRTGQTVFMNDVWLYTPQTGAWREVSQSDCKEGASGIARGGNWTALIALASMLVFVVVVQCFLHRICPQYQPPKRRRRRRSRRKTEDGNASGGASAGDGGAEATRSKSESSLQDTHGLLASSSSNTEKHSYQAVAAQE